MKQYHLSLRGAIFFCIIASLFLMLILIPHAAFGATLSASSIEDILESVSSFTFLKEEPFVVGRALTSWIALIAALIIFSLTGRYMQGGRLAKPIILIGFGALCEASIGLFVPLEVRSGLLWLGDLFFSVSVIIAIFWMERIFRSFSLE